MRSVTVLLSIAGSLMACTPTSEQTAVKPPMSLAQAEVHCEQYANAFARRSLPIPGEGGAIVGLLVEYPDDFQVQQFYKSCVRANSGVRTKKRVDWCL